MSERKLMKDGLSKHAISRLSSSLARVFPDFEEIGFQIDAFQGLAPLELKERVKHIIKALNRHLPADFEYTATRLRDLPEHWDKGDAEDPLNGFAAWPIIDYIAEFGMEDPDVSLETLRALTSLFSAEFAIRPFLLKYPEQCFSHLVQWINSDSEHVRRLVSEGTRPRLPWGQQLPPYIKNPSDVLDILELLKDDPSEYVRRSVANNLNDISKDHPERVIALCKAWSKNSNPKRQWIIRHATRTLVKQGHPGVFDLLGYTANPQVSVSSLLLDAEQLMLGQTLSFTFDLHSESPELQKLVIDYAVHFVKANGKTSPKVFKLKNLELDGNTHQRIVKTHAFKEITTRKYYEGEHRIEIIINGEPKASQSFLLYP